VSALALRRLSNKMLREAETWHDLAAYIDALNAEHEAFLTLINERRIGAHVPREFRPERVA